MTSKKIKMQPNPIKNKGEYKTSPLSYIIITITLIRD